MNGGFHNVPTLLIYIYIYVQSALAKGGVQPLVARATV
jgi:hypothetical protein